MRRLFSGVIVGILALVPVASYGQSGKTIPKSPVVRKDQSPVYDVETVARLFDIGYSKEELAAFGKPPDPLSGFVTFFDPGMSILRVRAAIRERGGIFAAQDWYHKYQSFAELEEKPRYRQLRMDAMYHSRVQALSEQKKLLAMGEEIPHARVVVTGMVVHFLITREPLYPTYWVRCRDRDADGNSIGVGRFRSGGFWIDGGWSDGPHGGLGLCPLRSPNPRK